MAVLVQHALLPCLLAAAMAMPALAAERPMTVSGACRDGVPNGGYELRMQDGRLRVSGAFHEGKRTGTFLFWNASGARLAAIPYDADARNGTIALWHVAGRTARETSRQAEVRVVAGALHGARLAWHANGARRSEAEYDHGHLVSASAWDARGRELPPEAARAEVEREVRDQNSYLERLERFVAEHRPRCE